MSKVVLVNMDGVGLPPRMPDDVVAVSTLRRLSSPALIARAVLRRIYPPSLSLFEKYNDFDKAIADASLVVLFDYKGIYNLIDRVNRLAPDARKVVFYWNALTGQKPINSPGWEIWTFAPEDARRFGLKYGGSFFLDLPKYNAHTSVDLCFIGRNKGRFPFLRRLKKALPPQISTDFRLVTHFAALRPGCSPALSYPQYLNAVASARVLLEVNAEGQTAVTMRTFEALATGRKLVTTNAAIKQYSFYSPEYIHILDSRPDINALIAFLNDKTPLPPVDMSEYTFHTWLYRLRNNITCPGYLYKA